MSTVKLLSSSVKKRRQNLSSVRFDIQQKLFARFQNLRTISPHVSAPQIPKLWCRLMSHYKTSSSSTPDIDIERNNLHLSYLSNYVGGYLINDSTSDAYTLTTKQQQVILQNILDLMHSDMNKYFHPILIGASAHDYDGKIEIIDRYVTILQEYYENYNIDYIYQHSPFVGFVLTPPSNTDDQKHIEQCLADIIERYKQFPFVLYQSPKVTNSEISIEAVTNLVHRFGNIIMLKDASDTDHIIQSQRCLDGVFMMREMEGNYMEALINMNYGTAQYHGLSLSSANNYAPQLNHMINHLFNANWNNAAQISKKIENVCAQIRQRVTSCADASKMIDFWMAHGSKGKHMIEMKDKLLDNIPMGHNGARFDEKDLLIIVDVLTSNGILSDDYVGYLNDSNYQTTETRLSSRDWWRKHS